MRLSHAAMITFYSSESGAVGCDLFGVMFLALCVIISLEVGTTLGTW